MVGEVYGLESLGKTLLMVGGLTLLLGVVLILVGKVPMLGRLPGDIVIHRGTFTFFFPLVTMILISLVLTVVVNVVIRMFR